MFEMTETNKIIKELYERIFPLFSDCKTDAFLFGSYARGTSANGSDIDLVFPADSSREEITEKNWQTGDIAGDLPVEHGIQISPIIENRTWFSSNANVINANVIPLYRNILQEGIRVNV